MKGAARLPADIHWCSKNTEKVRRPHSTLARPNKHLWEARSSQQSKGAKPRSFTWLKHWAKLMTSLLHLQTRCTKLVLQWWDYSVQMHRPTWCMARQRSHTFHTQARHYEVVLGPIHAAAALQTMESLWNEPSMSKEKEAEEKMPPQKAGNPKPKKHGKAGMTTTPCKQGLLLADQFSF